MGNRLCRCPRTCAEENRRRRTSTSSSSGTSPYYRQHRQRISSSRSRSPAPAQIPVPIPQPNPPAPHVYPDPEARFLWRWMANIEGILRDRNERDVEVLRLLQNFFFTFIQFLNYPAQNNLNLRICVFNLVRMLLAYNPSINFDV